MCEIQTRQALPSEEYRILLGTALCVFNSNNNFIIENILNSDEESQYNWYNLIDRTSGNLKTPIEETITKESDGTIELLFKEIADQRNRIIHSFQISDDDGEQWLATKDSNTNEQFVITKEYLIEFISKNEKLAILLDEFRGS